MPPWAYWLAHAIPFMTLPSGLWRLGLVAGSSMGVTNDAGHPIYLEGTGETIYVIFLSLFSEAVALIAFGLVKPWGEVAPRWIPFIGGRRVNPYAAIVPAVLGALCLIAIWTYGFRDLFTNHFIPFSSPAWKTLMIACYAPLQLWGPALLVLTWAYYRRRVSVPVALVSAR
ncbi:hypothetical protein EV652_101389 [Kribbella steppae]|uniref:Uncharacterized protein n=1 Tax=Kribbella steppae TaxID=2512223 RepID=A0A4R2HW58_9ACTN|nr:hypothetical protein EV652_101389 [Kribbella steppae]